MVLFVFLYRCGWTQINQPVFLRQNLFIHFIDRFNPLADQDSLLVLQEIGYSDYPEVLLDSTYYDYDFYDCTSAVDNGFFSDKAIPAHNNLLYTLIPFFKPYATFRIDCLNGYLVCIFHRYILNRTADLMFLEFGSFDKDGTLLSRLLLPYMVNTSEGDDFWSLSTLIYVSNSRLYYISSSYSNTHDFIDKRTIRYRIDNQGKLIFDSDECELISRSSLGKLGKKPPRFIILE